MLKFHKTITAVVSILILLSVAGFSQMNGNGYGNCDPDSLTPITVTGTAILDSTMMNVMYYLDQDGDGQADYQLNFGPFWYQPDSSLATRPTDGDNITISGGLHETTMMGFSTIIIYEINGEFWRDPFAPDWNYMGGHTHHGGHHQGGCNGFAFGWNHDSLSVETHSGTALVDTTLMFGMYYLDEDNDGTPDYHLNFGPPWYQPQSGATRPVDGDAITVVGGVLGLEALPMMIVYELNGETWRDSSMIGSHFGGGWIERNMTQAHQFHTPFDPEDMMQVSPGWHNGGNHWMGMMPDSLFCQMLEIFPQNIPNGEGMNILAGYEIGIFSPDGRNGMWNGGMCGNSMNFNSEVQFQMHYNDIQLQGENIDESSIQAKYWNNQTNSWTIVSDATVDLTNNSVSFATTDVSNFVVLTGATKPTGIEDGQDLLVKGFSLSQNYPNPFNPKTTIEFNLSNSSNVLLTVYNVLGQKMLSLLNEKLDSGLHTVNFDASSLPSGIYFYELKANGQSIVRRMNLLK